MAKNLSPEHPSIQIIPPTKEQNRFRYRIRTAGNDYNAFLTYELPRNSDDRNILLVNGSQSLITGENKPEYDRLVQRVSESVGRFAGVKNIVNRLAENEFANLPNVRIAVHKYGPVPVFVLPHKYPIRHLGEDIEVQIGVYPNFKNPNGSKRSVNFKLPFLSTKAEFVRSLDVGLGAMFQRYLEDVGEGMYDIKHHLSLAGIFDRAKEIESILAESIKSKLDVAMPSAQILQHAQSEDERLVRDLFEAESNWIFTARYARQFALYFLNELYRIIGLESRSSSYLGGFRDIQQQFDTLLGSGFVKGARAQLPLVATLSRTIRAYNDADFDTLKEINVDAEPLWVRRFVQFARFIGALDQEQLAPTAGRIFISYHHDVPVTEVLKAQIVDYINHHFPNRVEILSVKETGAGVKFKSPIRARIWLSDTVSEIVPKVAEAISGKVKDYLWIAREAEYGLLLGKRVIYLVEDGIDEGRIRADFMNTERDGSLIPATARVPDWLQKSLIESFTEHTRANFTVTTTETTREHLDPAVREIIHAEAERAIERRHRDILLGFYKQFPEAVRRTLKHIQQMVPFPKDATKLALSQRLSTRYRSFYPNPAVAEKAITNAWDLAKNRALLIDSRSMPLMRLLDRKKYSGNLREILKQLRPDMDKRKIEAWEASILKAVIGEDES